ncbi:N-methyl-L-tryptophan oxidase [Cellulosimicrobium sp. Marseille-Q4280]|uniref:N-methyl-L-tryptophan oxidase n=1 Tax=Cellulosimicrobium sp. Marseille-Q4280 TaxID=2937992 RepID=UPI00203B0F29|nr:N-methyl-L-tryptophan oxidase [Cellulosimicrobium sp. Marseille-Q4280]
MTWDAQVGVVGLGAAGSAALWRAAARGASVVGFEQHEPGHPHGSSHGHSRLFRTALVEGPQYVDLVRHAHGLWRELERASGRDLLTLTGGLFVGRPDGAMLTATLDVVRAHDLPHELLDAAQVRARFPQHAVDDDVVGLLDPGTGVLRPEAAIVAAVEEARRLGARVRSHERVVAVEPEGGGVVVHSDGPDGGRSWRVRRLVVAAGAWADRLLPALTVPHEVRRVLLTWFAPRPGQDAAHRPERFPAFVHEADGRLAWGAPAFEGRGVKVGLHDAPVPLVDDPSSNPIEAAPEEWREVAAWVAHRLPGLDPAAVTAEGCMYTRTPDEAFSIGEPAAYPGVVLAAACSGHGFKHASAVGDAVAALALDEAPLVDLGAFSPDRFGPRATGVGATLAR